MDKEDKKIEIWGTYEFYIAGIQHRKEVYEEFADQIEVETQLTLDPEPENPYDPNAVRILFGPVISNNHIGYVPMKNEMSVRVSSCLTCCDYVDCIVIEHNVYKAMWKRIKVRIDCFNKS